MRSLSAEGKVASFCCCFFLLRQLKVCMSALNLRGRVERNKGTVLFFSLLLLTLGLWNVGSINVRAGDWLTFHLPQP